MKCPICQGEMRRVGLGQVTPQGKVTETWECTSCHHRMPVEKKFMP